MAELTVSVSVSRMADYCDTMLVRTPEGYSIVDYAEAYYCPICDSGVSVMVPDNSCAVCGTPETLADFEDYHLAAPDGTPESDRIFRRAHLAEVRAMTGAAIMAPEGATVYFYAPVALLDS